MPSGKFLMPRAVPAFECAHVRRLGGHVAYSKACLRARVAHGPMGVCAQASPPARDIPMQPPTAGLSGQREVAHGGHHLAGPGGGGARARRLARGAGRVSARR